MVIKVYKHISIYKTIKMNNQIEFNEISIERDLRAEEEHKVIVKPINELSIDEKKVLLMNFLEDEIFVNSMIDTFSETELNNYMKQNSEVLNVIK